MSATDQAPATFAVGACPNCGLCFLIPSETDSGVLVGCPYCEGVFRAEAYLPPEDGP